MPASPIIQTPKNQIQMTWAVPNQVLQFSIDGIYTPDNAAQINEQLLELLDKATQPLTLIIDCMTMKRPSNFETIRQEQTFMNHPMLSQVYIASNDRLVRFAMMVIFSAASANIRLFDKLDQVQMMLDTRKIRRI